MDRRQILVNGFMTVLVGVLHTLPFISEGDRGKPVYWVFKFSSTSDEPGVVKKFIQDRQKYEDVSSFIELIHEYKARGELLSHKMVEEDGALKHIYHFINRQSAEAWRQDVLKQKELKHSLVQHGSLSKDLGIRIDFLEYYS